MKEINLNLLAKSNPEQTIREHTDAVLASLETLKEFKYITDNELLKLCTLACEYHDYGKMNDAFQNRIKTQTKFDEKKEIYHNIISPFFVPRSLKITQEEYINILYAILNHHHYTDNAIVLYSNRKGIYDKEIKEFGLDNMKMSLINNIKNISANPEQFMQASIILGILMKCDYSASASSPIEYKNDFLNDKLEKLFVNWKRSNNTVTKNKLQLYTEMHQQENLIITAPTGMGKTEASLLWLGNCKGFYVLPLKTAINSMYLRICEQILESETLDERIALLHSDSFSILTRYNEEFDILSYERLSRQLALPITVCTPDQIFNFIFKYHGFELKYATLSYSKIIIDEIQAYDAELLAYIIHGIHDVIRAGGKVAIFTATLPPYILKLLQNNMEPNTFVLQDFSIEQKNVRHNLKIIDEEINIEILQSVYENQSCKILVVCNTVKKAQEIYDQLYEEFQDEVYLLHARFIKKDRELKESMILQDGATNTHKQVIWVATQIVEASLDIDFDYIFTELSELSGLFQRLGRCNRKGQKRTDTTNCYVYTQIPKSLLITEYNNTKGIIDAEIYNASVQALRGYDGIITEQTKKQLLDEYFTYENLNKSEFIHKYRQKYEYVDQLYSGILKKEDSFLRRILTKSIIPNPVYEEYKTEIEINCSICSDKNKTRLDRQQAKNSVEQFCVSVAHYYVKRENIVKTLCVDKYTTIEVIDCVYSEERGFSSMKLEKKKETYKEDNSGLFI